MQALARSVLSEENISRGNTSTSYSNSGRIKNHTQMGGYHFLLHTILELEVAMSAAYSQSSIDQSIRPRSTVMEAAGSVN